MPKALADSPLLSLSTRRRFLGQALPVVGASVFGAPYLLRSQNAAGKLNIAVIGAGGKGSSDTDSVASENIVALCDIDQQVLDKRGAKYPKAKLYRDYRKLLDELGKSLDAVVVSTPDHHHAPASVLALQLGKPVYCQKPLTHSVYEARVMRDLAKQKKLATQMGNQGSAGAGLRRAVEVIQAGVIGPVRRLHVWSNRPIWPQGLDRPPGEDPVPAGIDWDLWLGPAPVRPYKQEVYHRFKWRGWQDFGTGALGDMACHTVNMPFRALKLGYPTSVVAKSSGMNRETYPKNSEITFEFPAREGLPPLTFTWYDGGNKPPQDLTAPVADLLEKMPGSGCLLVGDQGILFSPDDYGSRFFIKLAGDPELIDGSKHEAAKPVPETLPRSPGHYKEWLDAIRGGPQPYSNFDIAAYLTEIILLGCIALRVGENRKMEWDGPNMRSPNCPEAAQFVKRTYRTGWKV